MRRFVAGLLLSMVLAFVAPIGQALASGVWIGLKPEAMKWSDKQFVVIGRLRIAIGKLIEIVEFENIPIKVKNESDPIELEFIEDAAREINQKKGANKIIDLNSLGVRHKEVLQKWIHFSTDSWVCAEGKHVSVESISIEVILAFSDIDQSTPVVQNFVQSDFLGVCD